MNRILISLFLVLISLPSIAEEHASEGQSGTEKTGKRLAAEGKLSEDAIKFLSTHFYRSEEIIKLDYEKKIPDAIEKAIQNKDESDISKILAELVATTNPVQAQAVIDDAKKEIQQETEGKDPGKFDTRYVALMERLVWAAMNRNGELPDSENAQSFNEGFKQPYQDARAFVKKANEKLKSAALGNEQDRKWVDENVRKSTVLSLAEGQRKTGNKELSDNMIKGVSFKVGDQRVLDMWGPGKEPQRLYLGTTNESATQAIDKFLESKGSFGANSATREALPNDTKLKSWYIDGNGQFAKGSPKGFEPKEPEPPKETEGGGGSTQDFASYQSQVQQSVTANCQGCHATTVSGDSVKNLKFTRAESNSTRLAADFPAAMNATGSQMNMLSAPIKAQFEEFARIQRAAQ